MSEEKSPLPSCCQNNTEKTKSNKKGFLYGILYGLIPHSFCILFVVFSLIGSIIGASVVKKFLLIPYFFTFLILLSFVFATISAYFYLRKNSCCSKPGIKSNWKYLTILYGVTIGVNLLFFYLVFPAVIAATNNTNIPIQANSQIASNILKIQVDIPCSGHAPLIIDEVKKTDGVIGVNYIPQNTFEISYNPLFTDESSILSLEIFKSFKAKKYE